MTKQILDKNQEAVIHHLHHKTVEDDSYKRDVSINGNVFSVYLYSNDDKETIGFLTDKALYILNKLREGDK